MKVEFSISVSETKNIKTKLAFLFERSCPKLISSGVLSLNDVYWYFCLELPSKSKVNKHIISIRYEKIVEP